MEMIFSIYIRSKNSKKLFLKKKLTKIKLKINKFFFNKKIKILIKFSKFQKKINQKMLTYLCL